MRLLAALLAAIGVSSGQQPETPLLLRVPSVRAEGHARISAKPDQVRIDIGVLSQERTAQAAGAANAKQVTEVIAALKKAAGAGAEIQTVSYSVQPTYRYPKEGGTPTITGYTAQNIVRVRTPVVEKAGELIDAGTATGANQIRGIEFSVKDDRSLRAQALREAARDARSNAEAMAAGLGLKILRILRIEQPGTPEVRPMREMAMMRSAGADAAVPTPVESGTIEVQGTVVVTAEIGQ
jgi:uncharacterized protein YggE